MSMTRKKVNLIILIMAYSHAMQALRPLSTRCFLRSSRSISNSLAIGPRRHYETTLLFAGSAASVAMMSSRNSSMTTRCAPATAFSEDFLQYDHYSGVTLTLTDTFSMDENDFAETLADSLAAWKADGRKGIWIQVASSHSDKIHTCLQQGFEFHTVVHHCQKETTSNVADAIRSSNQALQEQDKVLVLTQWLPKHIPNRLPPGPTHQVGVGCLIFHPLDWNLENTTGVPPAQRRMLVVQEKTGPAAAWKLWKMPTGLADPGEDIHMAAVRECKEETGLDATFCGILAIRQAHAQPSIKNNKSVVMRAHSDLFAICILQLVGGGTRQTSMDDLSTLQTCPDEIADIQWMTVHDYCNQERWQSSPVYLELNRAILNASRQTLFDAATLPLGFSSEISSTNTLYKSALLK
ncbi:hypothetical protein MPSEU_000978400 [Mayamaea pseudoterrestris]|nr:hypothetical protein MPSEU_000978400 [Mayamaea pseudoterrestris]